MKKQKLMVLAAVLILSIVLLYTGCTTGNQDNKQGATQPGTTTQNDKTQTGDTTQPEDTKQDENKPAETYKDGTYEGKGDAWEHGSEDATVEIANGRITSIVLRRLDDKGNEVDYEKWTGQEVDGRVYPNLKEYRVEMANRMIEKQTYDVDTISGATVSTKNWKVAVQRALEKAK
ncbi:FMN-binding protein [Pseudoclostridium thermosuccinogenes]|jgi:uncharacterized protein with FMN-binding domain|nr:FMN-binding protein [Pseudoclostridium thermosuccinogenes]